MTCPSPSDLSSWSHTSPQSDATSERVVQETPEDVQTFEQEAAEASIGLVSDRHKARIHRGMLCVLVGGAAWGAFGTAAKYLLDVYHVEPLWLINVREFFSALLFLGAATVVDRKRLTRAIHDRQALGKIFAVSFTAILFSQIAYIYAVDATNSATATIMQALGMLGVLFFVCFKARRGPRKREVLGVVMALIGTYLLVTGGDLSSLRLPLRGVFWGALCACAQTALSILPKKLMEQWGNFVFNGIAFLFSSVCLAVVYQPWNHMPPLDSFGWILVVVGITVGTFLAYGLYLQGVQDAGSMRAVLLGTIEPVMATITTVIVLGTSFSVTDFIGFGLILGMVVLTA